MTIETLVTYLEQGTEHRLALEVAQLATLDEALDSGRWAPPAADAIRLAMVRARALGDAEGPLTAIERV